MHTSSMHEDVGIIQEQSKLYMTIYVKKSKENECLRIKDFYGTKGFTETEHFAGKVNAYIIIEINR